MKILRFKILYTFNTQKIGKATFLATVSLQRTCFMQDGYSTTELRS